MNTKMQRLSGLTVVLVVVVCGLFLCNAFFLGCEPPVEDDGAEEQETQHSEKESGDVPGEAEESKLAPDNQVTQESAPTPLSFTQESFLYYVLDHEETVVIRSAQEWQDYKRRSSSPVFIFQDGVLYVPEPEVNYTQEMLVAHSFGPVGEGGFNSMGVTKVQVENEAIRVYVSIDSPYVPVTGMSLLVGPIPQGFAVRLPQSDLPVQVVPDYY